jgi:hypothetical protein
MESANPIFVLGELDILCHSQSLDKYFIRVINANSSEYMAGNV